MNLKNILEVAATIIVSVGGAGVIICGVSNFIANKIADRLQAKYQLTLDKELEKHKSIIGNKNYISKTKFDAEFSIYRELSKVFSDLIRDVCAMIPYGFTTIPANPDLQKERDVEVHKRVMESYYVAQNTLNGNIPFIATSFVEEYTNILKECHMQCIAFERRWNISFLGTYEEKSVLTDEEYKRTQSIVEMFGALNNSVREYLVNLDVLN